MAIIISGFGHILVATNEQIVLLAAVLWLVSCVLGAGEGWLRNRYEWDRQLRRPVRRWYAAGNRITGVDDRRYYVLDYDTAPEQVWLRVAVDDEADESPSRWEPIAEFKQPVAAARQLEQHVTD